MRRRRTGRLGNSVGAPRPDLNGRTVEIVQALRAEAIALFQVNQAARTSAERILALTFAVIAIAAAALQKGASKLIALPLPSITCLLLSYMLQLYADVAVLGAGRLRLESQVNAILGDSVLIYETAIAGIRKSPPLVRSLRLVQGLAALAVAGVLALGTVVAIDTKNCLIESGYFVATGASIASLAFSLRHERTAFRVASNSLDKALGGET